MQQTSADRFAAEMAQSCMGSRIGRLNRIVARRFELALAPTGLTSPQLEILAALTTAGRPVPPSALAQVLAVERSTMSRNLALMRERGWIEPDVTSPSGRMMTVAVTAAGREAFAGARAAWGEAQEAVLAALGAGAPTELDGWLAGLGFDGLPAGVSAGEADS
jgi:DNA-binding MarR family transcriptional regulator